MTKTNKLTRRAANAKAVGKVIKSTGSKTATAAAAKVRRSAKAPATDLIVTVVGTRTGNGVFVESAAGKNLVISNWQNNAQTQKLARTGLPMEALVAHLNTIPKPAAKLAQGVEGKMTEHSRKAAEDSRKSAGSAKGRKARGDSAAVAGKAPKAAKAKSGGNGRGYDRSAKLTVIVKDKDAGVAAGSGRMAKLQFARKCKTVGDFLGQTVTDAGGKVHKCDAGALSGLLRREHVRLG